MQMPMPTPTATPTPTARSMAFRIASKAVMTYIARNREQQRQQVLRWLEESAPDPCRRDTGGSVMWAVTLHEMQAQLQRRRGGLSQSPASSSPLRSATASTGCNRDLGLVRRGRNGTRRAGVAPEDEEENLLLTVYASEQGS